MIELIAFFLTTTLKSCFFIFLPMVYIIKSLQAIDHPQIGYNQNIQTNNNNYSNRTPTSHILILTAFLYCFYQLVQDYFSYTSCAWLLIIMIIGSFAFFRYDKKAHIFDQIIRSVGRLSLEKIGLSKKKIENKKTV